VLLIWLRPRARFDGHPDDFEFGQAPLMRVKIEILCSATSALSSRTNVCAVLGRTEPIGREDARLLGRSGKTRPPAIARSRGSPLDGLDVMPDLFTNLGLVARRRRLRFVTRSEIICGRRAEMPPVSWHSRHVQTPSCTAPSKCSSWAQPMRPEIKGVHGPRPQ